MLDFTYYTPTKVYFGKDTHKDVGAIIHNYGFRTIMLQYGQSSIKTSGLYDEVMTSLARYNITVVEMGGVEPNPKLSFVREAVKLAKEKKVELILAVGGGSVIDSCKCTAAGVANDCDVWEFSSGKKSPTKSLPIGCILTLAAAGSEMSASAVLTNMEENMKRGFNSDFNRPLFAICNPVLTYSVSKYQTACGVVDIMMHTMERYFTDCTPTDLTDRLSESLLKSVIAAGTTLMTHPDDYDARANMMWASSLSHNGLTGCGRINKLAVHQLEHALSGEYDYIAHGAGLAVLFPAWAEYTYQYNLPRFAGFARNVWDVTDTDDTTAALEGIRRMRAYFASIGMPTRLREFDIPQDCTERLALLTTFHKTREIESFVTLDYTRIKEIFDLSW